jgi:hypothetical protein
MKLIRLSHHAMLRCRSRGTTPDDVRQAIRCGRREPAKGGRVICRLNLQYNKLWRGGRSSIKQVAPVIVEKSNAIVVVNVYTFFF